MSTSLNDKERVGQAVAERVKNGELIAVGTGSTVDAAIVAIGKRIQSEGLRVPALVTSYESAWRCEQVGIEVLASHCAAVPVWGFDGADEVDAQLRAIKGKGGALLREKLLATRCPHFVLIVDDSKVVEKLGQRCAVPVEVIPEARWYVESSLKAMGGQEVTLRQGSGKHGPIVTEYGNVILDVQFAAIPNGFERELKSIIGVIDSGLFENQAAELLVSGGGKTRVVTRA